MRALVVGLMISTATPALAADEKGIIFITGAGNSTCGQWLDAVDKRREIVEAAYTQWVLGFVGGRNAYAAGNAKVQDFQSARHFGRKHCRDNPLDNVFAVGAALVKATDPANLSGVTGIEWRPAARGFAPGS